MDSLPLREMETQYKTIEDKFIQVKRRNRFKGTLNVVDVDTLYGCRFGLCNLAEQDSVLRNDILQLYHQIDTYLHPRKPKGYRMRNPCIAEA